MFSNIIRKIVPKSIIEDIEKPYRDRLQNGKLSFSQEGEDMILSRYYEGKQTGFYVDIGAHHPFRFSNTYYFYLLGWYGINIDARPESMKKFNEYRNKDINLEVAISNTDKSMEYYDFEESALNGFSPEISLRRINNGNKLTSINKIKTYKLSEILEEHLPIHQHIDFMSIDVEGLDLDVLQSNNWKLYRPSIVLVEDLYKESICDVLNGDLDKYMKSINYTTIAKSVNTVFYKNMETF